MEEVDVLTVVRQYKVAIIAGCVSFPILIGAYRKLREKKRRQRRLPPGPKGHPLVGNLLQIPTAAPWEVYHEWSQKFGGMVYLEALGNCVLLLDTLEHSLGLMEKHSATTSGRPTLPSLEIFDQNFNVGGMDYGPEWKAHRRAVHQSVNENQIHKFFPIVEEEVQLFLKRVLADPDNLLKTTHTLFGHIIMRIAYGVKDLDYNEELVQEAEEQLGLLSACFTQGRFLVDIFPALRYLPSWLPGMGWKRWLQSGAKKGKLLYTRPFNDARARAHKGDASTREYHSITQHMIESLPSEDDPTFAQNLFVAQSTAAVAYLGGSDTTTTSAHALFFALALHPEVQKKAQEELDIVTDNGSRLPTYADIEHLPYIQAILKEVTRWHSVTPLGVPHLTHADIEYNGYFIPKGTIVRPNIWAMAHDPAIFEDPFAFKPERFLKNGKLDVSARDPDFIAFGRGRRICPGRHLSKQNLTLMTMSLLSVFEIRPSSKEGARPLELKVSTDMISKIAPFDVEIRPRSQRHAQLIG